MQTPVILGALRTPLGSFQGGLKGIPAPRLAGTVAAELLRRLGVPPADVDELILGNVIGAGLGQNPARQAAVLSGLPFSSSAFTVDMVCGSGLRAVCLAAQAVALGESAVVVAGGAENMSRAPHLVLRDAPSPKPLSAMRHDGLHCAFRKERRRLRNTGLYVTPGLCQRNPKEENPMKRLAVLLAAAMLLCAGIGAVQAADKELMMATTTSTDNTGLLPVLSEAFKKDTGIELKWTAVGTGKALELGKNCDVDVLLVHAPKAEMEFVAAGHGLGRTEVMFNDFVLLGPKADPAKVKGKTTAEALKAIAASKSPFISRGDDSGTHKMELALWKAADLSVPDKETWYVQAGQGMMATIVMAAERNGYTLTDRATYFTYEAKNDPVLAVLVEGDKPLLNQYSVIVINPEKCKNAKVDLAKTFSDWLASPKGQQVVADFKSDGKQLFTPNAQK